MFQYCPRDNSGLTQKNIEGVDLFQCARCHGVWIPKDSLLTLASSRNISPLTDHIAGESLPPHFTQGSLSCPLDNTNMHFHSIGAIEVDVCSACHGVWLDKGELESLPKEKQPVTTTTSNLIGNTLDVLFYLPPIGPDAVQVGLEVAGGAASVAAEAASGAGELLGNLLSAIAEALFSG
jgi:Zn-finger nucleic acid-binding protein